VETVEKKDGFTGQDIPKAVYMGQNTNPS